MSLRRASARAFGFAGALALTVQGGALGQTAFPRTTMQPSAYSTGVTSRPLAGAALPPPIIASTNAQTVRVDLAGPGAQSRMLSLPRGKSAVIELPVDARDVLV